MSGALSPTDTWTVRLPKSPYSSESTVMPDPPGKPTVDIGVKRTPVIVSGWSCTPWVSVGGLMASTRGASTTDQHPGHSAVPAAVVTVTLLFPNAAAGATD